MELCDRFKCLPGQLWDEDAELMRLIRIERLGKSADDNVIDIESAIESHG